MGTRVAAIYGDMCRRAACACSVHHFGYFCLAITPVGSGRLLVNTTHFHVPATDSQLLSWLSIYLRDGIIISLFISGINRK